MTLLIKPSEASQGIILMGLIYGQPGVCKSTLALSAPDPVMVDADRGMYRVEKRFQKPALPLNDYEGLLELMQSPELDPFQTIVFDTMGKLIDRIADYLMRTNPKLRQSDGSLTLKGYGGLRVEFQKLLKLARMRNKYLLFVAHEKEEKDGDLKVIRPDIPGSSGRDLMKDLDFVGYVEMRGDKRTISFTPSERFYAKNSLKLPQIIEIPHTDDHPNDFIQRVIVARTMEKQVEEAALSKQYDELLQHNAMAISAIETPEDATKCLKEINAATAPIWDSSRVAKKGLIDRTKELGFIYNKTASKFEATKTEKQNETSSDPIAA